MWHSNRCSAQVGLSYVLHRQWHWHGFCKWTTQVYMSPLHVLPLGLEHQEVPGGGKKWDTTQVSKTSEWSVRVCLLSKQVADTRCLVLEDPELILTYSPALPVMCILQSASRHKQAHYHKRQKVKMCFGSTLLCASTDRRTGWFIN